MFRETVLSQPVLPQTVLPQTLHGFVNDVNRTAHGKIPSYALFDDDDDAWIFLKNLSEKEVDFFFAFIFPKTAETNMKTKKSKIMKYIQKFEI